jgi:hypothetical protein
VLGDLEAKEFTMFPEGDLAKHEAFVDVSYPHVEVLESSIAFEDDG